MINNINTNLPSIKYLFSIIKKINKIYFLLAFILTFFIILYGYSVHPISNKLIFNNLFSSDTFNKVGCFKLAEDKKELILDLDNFFKNNNTDKNMEFFPEVYFVNMPKKFVKFLTPEDVLIRKRVFISILLPILIAEQIIILKEREEILEIINKINKEPLNDKDISIIKSYSLKYKVNLLGDNIWSYVLALDELLVRVNIIPHSLALAVAIKETGWGISRFLHEGNSIFSEWSWNENLGIIPLNRNVGATHAVKKYPNLQKSVHSFFLNLNSHSAYEDFRRKRNFYAIKNQPSNSIYLSNELLNYSTERESYIAELKQIILNNKLEEYDKYKGFLKQFSPICFKVV